MSKKQEEEEPHTVVICACRDFWILNENNVSWFCCVTWKQMKWTSTAHVLVYQVINFTDSQLDILSTIYS